MESSFTDDKEDVIKEPLLKTSPKGGIRTMPFIIANGMLERVATFGLTPNMTLYLMRQYHMEMTTASNILFYWSAASNFLPILGAIFADSYVGRFHVIGFGSVVSLLGMILLWLTSMIPQATPPPCNDSNNSCSSTTFSQLLLLLASFALISIGSGGIRSSSLVFGVDQLQKEEAGKGAGELGRYFSWCYASYMLSILIAFTIMVYIQENMGWQFGFGVCVVVMFFSAISFFLATPFYVKVKAKASLLTEPVKVIVSTYKNRALKLSSSTNIFHQKNGSALVFPSAKMRFLNKACVIIDPEKDLNADGRPKDPWSLCTVDQVEDLKAVLKVIPIWSTGMIAFVTINQGSFSILQVHSMNRKIGGNFEIPAGSFGIFTIITLILWVALYDQVLLPLASKIKGKPVYVSARKRMGIGIFLYFLSMIVTAAVEYARRSLAIKQGVSDDPEAVVDMSAVWLLPQHCLMGVAEGLNAIAQNEFYISEFPRDMSSLASNLGGVGMSGASLLASFLMNSIDDLTKRGGQYGWISSNINKGHYDYYFWVLAGLSMVNMMYFLICCWTYGPCRGEEGKACDEEVLLQ